jgi:hypothetical protein
VNSGMFCSGGMNGWCGAGASAAGSDMAGSHVRRAKRRQASGEALTRRLTAFGAPEFKPVSQAYRAAA